MFVQIENILRFLSKTELYLLSKIHFLPCAFHAWKAVYFFQSFCKYFSRDISCPIPYSPSRMPSQRAHFSLRCQVTENGVHQQCTGRWLWLLQVQGPWAPVSSTADWLVWFASQVWLLQCSHFLGGPRVGSGDLEQKGGQGWIPFSQLTPHADCHMLHQLHWTLVESRGASGVTLCPTSSPPFLTSLLCWMKSSSCFKG